MRVLRDPLSWLTDSDQMYERTRKEIHKKTDKRKMINVDTQAVLALKDQSNRSIISVALTLTSFVMSVARITLYDISQCRHGD